MLPWARTSGLYREFPSPHVRLQPNLYALYLLSIVYSLTLPEPAFSVIGGTLKSPAFREALGSSELREKKGARVNVSASLERADSTDYVKDALFVPGIDPEHAAGACG